MNHLIVNQRIIFHLNLIQDQLSKPIDKNSFIIMLETASGHDLLCKEDVDSAFFKLCEKRQSLGLSFDDLNSYIKHGAH